MGRSVDVVRAAWERMGYQTRQQQGELWFSTPWEVDVVGVKGTSHLYTVDGGWVSGGVDGLIEALTEEIPDFPHVLDDQEKFITGPG